MNGKQLMPFVASTKQKATHGVCADALGEGGYVNEYKKSSVCCRMLLNVVKND